MIEPARTSYEVHLTRTAGGGWHAAYPPALPGELIDALKEIGEAALFGAPGSVDCSITVAGQHWFPPPQRFPRT